jgi:hypothetical protein
MAQSGKLIPIIQVDNIESFAANPRLKKAGQKFPMTQDQVMEYAKCAEDPDYFIENYAKIVSIDHGVIPFGLYDYQKKMVRKMHRWNRIIMRAARQSGKTQTCAAYILWFILFHSSKTVAILANKQDTATEILGRIQDMYMHVPLWMQQGIDIWNKTSFLLENGSRVLSSSTSSNAIRGFTISLLYLDEYAHVPNNVASNFFTSVYPTISSGKTAKVIISSTPNGMNHFCRMFTDAVNKKNQFKAITVKWDQVPGRNKLWKAEQLSVMSEEKFLQEQEVEFMGSAGTLISSAALRNLAYVNPMRTLLDAKFRMYEDVKPNHRYILTADVSHGKELDFSACSIIDVTEMPYRAVGVYHSNDIPAELYPNVISQLARYYNMAYCLVENNDIGSLVLKILIDDLEYENVFYTDSHNTYKPAEITSKTLKTPGLRTTSKSKRQGCNALKQLVENAQLLLLDFETISELTTFIVKPNKTYAAAEDCHDDLVMTLVLFAWITTQDFFKDLANSDARQKMYSDRARLIEEDMPAAPVFIPSNLPNNKVRMDNVIWEVVSPQDDDADNRWTGFSSLS